MVQIDRLETAGFSARERITIIQLAHQNGMNGSPELVAPLEKTLQELLDSHELAKHPTLVWRATGFVQYCQKDPSLQTGPRLNQFQVAWVNNLIDDIQTALRK